MQYIIPLIVIFLSISSAAEGLGAQHLIVGFHGTEPKNEEVQQAQRLLREGLIRGVILFRHNIDNPHQLKRLTEFLLKSGRKDMIISIDQEGGAVSRMDQANGFAFTMPSAGSYETAEAVYEQFYNVGKMLKEYNINLNFAPVLDVDENKSSPVIGKIARSFSGNVDAVAEYGAAAIQGLREGGVASCAKHFPGHGSAATDSHKDFTDVSNSWKKEVDLKPFEELQKTIPCIMVSHLYNRNIDIHHPASVSSKYYHMLPQYHGLYVTDDYFMAAVADKYTEGEFLILAIKAGADLVIFGRHPKMMKMLNKPIIPLVDFVNDLVKTHAKFP